MNSLKVYVINLDRSPKRLEKISTGLRSLNIDYERICGVDGLNISRNKLVEYVQNARWKKEITLGEIGCYLSHMKALRTFLESQSSFALVLEDDAILAPDTIISIQRAIKDLKKHRWDMLNLCSNAQESGSSINIAKNIVKLRKAQPPFTGVVWTRKGAENFLNNPPCQAPVDLSIRILNDPNIYALFYLPRLVNISGDVSIIDEISSRAVIQGQIKKRIRPRGCDFWEKKRQSCIFLKVNIKQVGVWNTIILEIKNMMKR